MVAKINPRFAAKAKAHGQKITDRAYLLSGWAPGPSFHIGLVYPMQPVTAIQGPKPTTPLRKERVFVVTPYNRSFAANARWTTPDMRLTGPPV